ncbi:hypothetical protein D9757_013459 [Collybiopsis confluens]|uniref:Uncharacterized protein n=1 Tax=Collybiopsis confluens TaxID=2823264 RepID=A0A8H5LL74_9AGAR|nr:hypothetical protein D9757_013459 [Collybiopsis confluens]
MIPTISCFMDKYSKPNRVRLKTELFNEANHIIYRERLDRSNDDNMFVDDSTVAQPGSNRWPTDSAEPARSVSPEPKPGHRATYRRRREIAWRPLSAGVDTVSSISDILETYEARIPSVVSWRSSEGTVKSRESLDDTTYSDPTHISTAEAEAAASFNHLRSVSLDIQTPEDLVAMNESLDTIGRDIPYSTSSLSDYTSLRPLSTPPMSNASLKRRRRFSHVTQSTPKGPIRDLNPHGSPLSRYA